MAQSSVKWTDKQLAAINERDKTLLVSAAAGSGKTAVLTKRIIDRLCDTEKPADISRTLIVTYTKAAANELKTRISKALSEAIAENPQNRHLRKQLLLLTSAKICTIHSFCLDVIKRNSKELSLPNNFGIANENELNLIAENIMGDVINEAYAGKLSGDFSAIDFISLSNLFSKTGMDTAFETSLLTLYTKLESFPEGVEFIKNSLITMESELSLPFYQTVYGRKILRAVANTANHLYKKYQSFEKVLSIDEEAYSKYIPLISDEKSFLNSFCTCIDEDMAENAKRIFDAFEVQRLPSLKRGYQSEFTQELKDLRNILKDSVIGTLKEVFSQDENIRAFESTQTCRLVKCLYVIMKEFDDRFIEEKKKSGRLSYNDLERFTFSLLVSKQGPTDSAREIAAGFDEIYIDEYQDTNALQDMIFSSISTPTNRFMVGDIKQSIYGFRGAAPENFAKYRDSFPVLSDENKDFSQENTIFLSDNFRCDKSVVDFCNTVFSCIFRNATGRISYYDSDNLGFSKIDGDKNCTPVKVILAKKPSDEESPFITEAEYIANEVKRLITSEKKSDGSQIKPSDIAILFRKKMASVEIEAELNKLYIPTSNSIETEFFENPEILLVMALLNTIDNPMRDIHLAGTLKSPLFRFTLDELVLIRAYSKKASLFEALVDYTEDNDFPKGRYFLERLNYFRKIAEGSRVDRLIKLLYRKLSLFSIVSQNKAEGITPESARENLMLLYSYARDFESSSFKGLSSFIEFVDDIISNNKKVASASGSNASEAVQLMTIHHSKGLEFPVVFIASAEKTPSSMDLRSTVLIEKHTGISIDLPGLLPGTKIKTLYRKAMEIAINENVFEEEMRVLYVALTRARERLYISGSYNDPELEYQNCKEFSENISPEIIMSRRSFMQLTLIPILADKNMSDRNYELIFPKPVDVKDFDNDEATEKEYLSEEKQDEIIAKIKENLSFEYPYKLPISIPSKISVSRLKGNVLDNSFDESCISDDLSLIKPAFLSEEISAPTAADKGTATHTFMQFANFENVEKNGVVSEIERMLDLSYFDSNTAQLIDTESVLKFFESDFYKNTIRTSKKLWREHRFNIEMPAHPFTANAEVKEKIKGENLFVQGIIDLFIQSNDGTYTLIDYKTDHISREYSGREKDFEELLAERHREQLSYYKYALEKITKGKVSRVLIYSFALNREIDITDKCNLNFQVKL